MSMLDDPRFTVVAVPAATTGVAWLRASVARFSEGDDHVRRRRLAETLLAGIDPDELRRPGVPIVNLAAALGLASSATLAADVADVARTYQPHAAAAADPATIDRADRALGRLVELCGGRWDEHTAARIGLLVQACDATEAMIAGTFPPVAHTRRVAPDGGEVLVDLTDTPFGAGRHACPGRDHALAMVEGALAFGSGRDAT